MKLLNNRKSPCIVLLFIFSIAAIMIVGIFIVKFTGEPKVSAVVTLSNITEDEFYGLDNHQNYDYNDIKKLAVRVEINNSLFCKSREIKVPNLMKIDQLDEGRSFRADQGFDNVKGDDHAGAYQSVVFNSSGLTVDDLKRLYRNETIKVEIITYSGVRIVTEYPFGDLIQEKTVDETKE